MAVSSELRTFKNAAWLGWQMEANWTDPFLFAIYSVVKPLAGTLILVFMYLVITHGETETMFFSYMYVGNAMYMFVADVLFGVTWVIHDDREHYMTLKQVYIAPIKFETYIFGRAAIKIAITSFGVLMTLLFGVFVLGVDIDLAAVNWPLLVVALVLGLVTLAIMGLALGGVTFLTAKHAMGINEGVAGIFYVLSGVIFPITILPDWAQSISKFLPVTYWMEGIRRGLEPGVITALGPTTGLQGFSDLQLLLILVVTAVAFLFISLGIFRYADKVARRKGKIDWTSAY
ncbi:ABC transporter permease [Candidatus Bathyarchaeota archaeon]|nr:ABC transporter permease [Candidatus Bathyarchaeota archaeon]